MQLYMPIHVLRKIASLMLQENVTKLNNSILYCTKAQRNYKINVYFV